MPGLHANEIVMVLTLQDRRMSARTLYDELGCDKSSTTEQILTEFRVRVRDVHPDKSGRDAEQFCRLQEAKDILTDPAKRKHYDAYLAMGSIMPLNEWMKHRENLQQSMHWANPPQPTPMIASNEQTQKPQSEPWIRHENSTISAFRNYDI